MVQAVIAFRGEGQAPGLVVLVLPVTAPDGAPVGVEHIPAQGVHALALVELAADLAAVVRPGQVPGGVDGAPERPVFLERGCEGVLPVGAGQLGHDQRGGDVPVLQAGRQPQHLVPVLGDQLEVDAPGQQRTCDRELGAHLGAAPSAGR